MRALRTFFWGSLIALVTGVGGGLYALHRIRDEIEQVRAGLPKIHPPGHFRPPTKTEVYAADGTLLTEIFRENREMVPYEQIPPRLIEATIASEDRRFYHHIGVSPRDIVRAVVANARRREVVQGASTITQQLARDLYLNRQQTWDRKAREALLAIEIERQYAKEEILELYLNLVNYGKGAYGVRTAARMYFDKEPRQLTLGECAALAAVPRRPASYYLYADPREAVRRRDAILASMVKAGFVSATQGDAARAEKLRLRPYQPPNCQPRRAAYYTTWAVRELLDLLGEETVLNGGLRVWTNLDLHLQSVAEDAVRDAVRQARGRGADQGAAVLMEVGTGRVLALVGGVDWHRSQFNRATQAHRQPGSAFKPIVYAVAIDRGRRPSDTILDAPLKEKLAGGETWEPENYDHRWHGEVTLLTALAQSINIPAVKLLKEVGVEPVVSLAQRMGIRSPLRPVLSLALGTSEVTLLELTAAYGTFPGGGYVSTPGTLLRIEDAQHRVLYRQQPRQAAVLVPGTAQVMVGMMQEVMRSGTGKPAAFDAPCAGKTGTTQDGRDAWFLGYTPRLVCGVWLGNDAYHAMDGVYGGTHCGPAWRRILMAGVAAYGAGDFPSAGLGAVAAGGKVEISGEALPLQLRVCDLTGLRAAKFCPHTHLERFAPGEEPQESCPLHTEQAETPDLAPRSFAPPEPAPEPVTEEHAPAATPPPKAAPPGGPAPLIEQYVVCRESGLLAKAGCPDKVVVEFPPGKAPSKECNLH